MDIGHVASHECPVCHNVPRIPGFVENEAVREGFEREFAELFDTFLWTGG
jgi:hypothetical protein